MVMVDENVADSSGQEEEYDTGEDPFGSLFHLEPELDPNQDEKAAEEQLSVYEEVEFLEIEETDGAGATSPTTAKEEEGEPLNLLMMSTSLDNDASTASDCVITAAYIVSYDSEDEANEK